MNILNLLIKEKHIVGVEISDNFVRIAYFRPKKKSTSKIHLKKTPEILESDLILVEKEIASGIISEGIVQDKESLGKILKDIWTKEKLQANYAIVAIPEDKIYSQIFTFPKVESETHLEEAVSLAIDFQLPVKKDNAYVDWENIGDTSKINEILISSIPKNIADDYIQVLKDVGIKILALESHLASIVRSIKLETDQATLFTKENSEGVTIFILKDNAIHFSRNIPKVFIKENNFLEKEIDRIKTSFESENKITIIESPLINATIKDAYLKYPTLQNLEPETQSKWLIAVGAAIRGEIPKGKDNKISLLPIGTAEAYAYQKRNTFIVLIRNMTIGVSIFFLCTFFVAYLFIYSLSQKTNKIILNTTISPVYTDIVQKETIIKKLNTITQTSKTILETTANWSLLLDDLKSNIISGITITNFSASSINDPMTLVGLAKDRETLNQFKKSLQTSTYLDTVELPITNLEQKGNIPFSISFHVKDPSMLYYK